MALFRNSSDSNRSVVVDLVVSRSNLADTSAAASVVGTMVLPGSSNGRSVLEVVLMVLCSTPGATGVRNSNLLEVFVVSLVVALMVSTVVVCSISV